MTLPGGSELLIIMLILTVLFGARQLPKLARSIGQSTKELKEGLREAVDGDPAL